MVTAKGAGVVCGNTDGSLASSEFRLEGIDGDIGLGRQGR
jgi:hypothetical protein